MKSINLFLFIFLIVSCNAPNTKNQRQKAAQDIEIIEKESLLGGWETAEWDLYHTLIFSNNNLFMDNQIDTIFNYNYELVGNQLKLKDIENDTLNLTILKVNEFQLTIRGLFDETSITRYDKIEF